jgi:hypothetical protein
LYSVVSPERPGQKLEVCACKISFFC